MFTFIYTLDKLDMKGFKMSSRNLQLNYASAKYQTLLVFFAPKIQAEA